MHGFRLARLFGVELSRDRSWAVIFVLLTSSLTSSFSGWRAASPGGEILAVPTCAWSSFFGCVLAHE